jgi:23S rRNA (adenine2030-N6)-methyltransferase
VETGKDGYHRTMLSYRHSFHAGNAADVLKHMTLIFCLDYLTGKEKPLLCVDTHAGAGLYQLGGRIVNREWEGGLGKLRAAAAPDRASLPAMASRYLELTGGGSGLYPGSPLLMAELLHSRDRLVCFELHPADYRSLKNAMEDFRGRCPGGKDKTPGIEVRREDGPGSLKALLPPLSRRGLILVDPSWEEKAEYELIPLSLAGALRRFPQGTYLVWYPLLSMPKDTLKGSPAAAAFQPLPEILLGLYDKSRCRLELHAAPEKGPAANSQTGVRRSPRGMYGSGMIIFNPPWTLRAALEETLPFLASVLGRTGDWSLEWKE